MNYKKIYDTIIFNRIDNPPTGYAEKHHIHPRSLGGDNTKENIVSLTAREHFICHFLLTKMYKKNTNSWYKMNHAFMIMKASNIDQYRYFNSRLYESCRNNFKEVMSQIQSGEKNSQYGTRWIHNIEKQKNKKIINTAALPLGWQEGRRFNWFNQNTCSLCKGHKSKSKASVCKDCAHDLKRAKNKQNAYIEFTKYVNSDFDSLTSYAKNNGTSQPRLTKLFTKHIVGYVDIQQHGVKVEKKQLKKLLGL
jgi:hypothetical protein